MRLNRDDAKLRTLLAQFHEVKANIKRLQLEQQGLQEEIVKEREWLKQERARTAAALEMNVMAQWDSGRSVSQIATALGRSSASVNKILAEWRQREGVTIRRGQPIRDRRMLR